MHSDRLLMIRALTIAILLLSFGKLSYACDPETDPNCSRQVGPAPGTRTTDKPEEPRGPSNQAGPAEPPELAPQQREQALQRNLEDTIQKVGAKVDRPQPAPDEVKHNKGERPDDQNLSQYEISPKYQPTQVSGTLEMPSAKKNAEVKAQSEAKLKSVIGKIQSNNLKPEEKAKLELLIKTYNDGPRDEGSANQIVSQIMNLSPMTTSTRPPESIEADGPIPILKAGEPMAVVIQTSGTTGVGSESLPTDTSKKLGEFAKLLKVEKTPKVLAARELSNQKASPSLRTPNRGALDEAFSKTTLLLKDTAKGWIKKIIQALTEKKPADRMPASLGPLDDGRETASTPELKVDATIHQVDASVGPLTAKAEEPEPEPQIPNTLLLGLGIALTGVLLILAKLKKH